MSKAPEYVILILHKSTGYIQHHSFDGDSLGPCNVFAEDIAKEAFIEWAKKKKISKKETADYNISFYAKVWP